MALITVTTTELSVPCCGVGLGAIKVVVKLYRKKETIAFQMFDNIDEWYGDLIRPGAAKPLMYQEEYSMDSTNAQ
ncbi:hypothetical protein EYF80_039102 [Liparis tanakae]|uniref:Uncharacterized protein n=1 Tax=Liparis tanakae TaxID=230148 RepID=A0A4Z2GCR9_9TELE|nr:hypothetical protein EYF80_039102 [Liparis tanakae]